MKTYAIEISLVEISKDGVKKPKFTTLQHSWSGTFTEDVGIARRVLMEIMELETARTREERCKAR